MNSKENGHAFRRAIFYARVPTQEQAERGHSVAQQLETLREYAAREGYEILEEVQESPARARCPSKGPAWTACAAGGAGRGGD